MLSTEVIDYWTVLSGASEVHFMQGAALCVLPSHRPRRWLRRAPRCGGARFVETQRCTPMGWRTNICWWIHLMEYIVSGIEFSVAALYKANIILAQFFWPGSTVYSPTFLSEISKFFFFLSLMHLYAIS